MTASGVYFPPKALVGPVVDKLAIYQQLGMIDPIRLDAIASVPATRAVIWVARRAGPEASESQSGYRVVMGILESVKPQKNNGQTRYELTFERLVSLRFTPQPQSSTDSDSLEKTILSAHKENLKAVELQNVTISVLARIPGTAMPQVVPEQGEKGYAGMTARDQIVYNDISRFFALIEKITASQPSVARLPRKHKPAAGEYEVVVDGKTYHLSPSGSQ